MNDQNAALAMLIGIFGGLILGFGKEIIDEIKAKRERRKKRKEKIMATIEERATKFANVKGLCIDCASVDHHCMECETRGKIKGYIKGATDQDRIARKEERERCINAAISCICKECSIGYCENSVLCGQCETRVNVRKAIENENE